MMINRNYWSAAEVALACGQKEHMERAFPGLTGTS